MERGTWYHEAKHSERFFTVPSGATIDPSELDKLLRPILDLLAGEDIERCSPKVSDANRAAFARYRSEGLTVTEKHSTWYEVHCHA